MNLSKIDMKHTPGSGGGPIGSSFSVWYAACLGEGRRVAGRNQPPRQQRPNAERRLRRLAGLRRLRNLPENKMRRVRTVGRQSRCCIERTRPAAGLAVGKAHSGMTARRATIRPRPCGTLALPPRIAQTFAAGSAHPLLRYRFAFPPRSSLIRMGSPGRRGPHLRLDSGRVEIPVAVPFDE
jgi:hypothetical protein